MQKFNNENNLVLADVADHLSVSFGCRVIIKSSKFLGGGCINHASKIETNIGDYFLKWNSNCEADLFIREAESLVELKKASGDFLKIPEVFASKERNETPGFLVQEYFLPGNSTPRSDEKLGRGLAAIHQYKSEKYGFYNNNYCGATPQNNAWKQNWAEFYRDNRLRFLLKLIQKERPLPNSELTVLENFLNKLPQLIPNESEPVLIHGDLWSGNFLISGSDPVLIDPASYYASREMEFAIITMFGGFSYNFYSAYNEMNPLPSDWRNRNSIYQFYHVLNHYFLFGGAYKKQALDIVKGYL